VRWSGYVVAAAVVVPLALLPGTPVSAAPAATALSGCVPSDNGDPVVGSATTAPTTVDTTRRTAVVALTVAVTDTGGPGEAAGVGRVLAQLWGPQGKVAPEHPVRMRHGAGDTWTARLAVPRGSVPGTYTAHLAVHDLAGNVALAGAGTDMPLPSAAVTVNSVADSRAPRLMTLRLGRTTVDTRAKPAHVTVTARATDGRAGVKRVLVTAGNDRRSTSVLLRRVSGTATDGRWRGALTVPRWLGTTTWRLQVGVVDGVVNARTYGWAALGALKHADRAITVRSRADKAAPRGALTVTPTTVNVGSQPQVLTLQVHARDAGSGVAGVRVLLLDPVGSDSGREVALHRTSGSPRDGVWSAAVTISTCAIGGSWRTELEVTDRSLRSAQYRVGLPTLEVVANDNQAPTVVRTSTGSGTPVLDFDEDVTGITPTSAPVIAADGGVPVAGAWTCTDVTGATTSCAAGTVRRAAFTPVAPSTSQLFVLLNPEHSLGVTDLAGNPVGRRYTV
jgi:hypothetical protein